MSENVCIVGSGYVGLVTGACLSELGHRVVCVDSDKKKIAVLRRGSVPFFEPGLKNLVQKNCRAKRLSFATKISDGMRGADIVFIAVNTPSLSSGDADLSFVEAVAREVAKNISRHTLIVEKSTVPVKTGEKIKQAVKISARRGVSFEVASNPEFLREGSAIHDFLHPDRIVIGVESPAGEATLRRLYAKVKAPILVTDIKSAELIKHSSNSFLATKISFINAVAQVCERVGADVTRVAEGMGLDARIGKKFLSAGIGFGGSCFPKDLSAFIRMADEVKYDFKLLKAVQEINRLQRQWVVEKLREALWNLRGKKVAILGLAFKPDTDDLRNAPALDIADQLHKEGVHLRVYDPVAMIKAKPHISYAKFCRSPYEAAKGADAVVLATEWKECATLNLKRLKSLMSSPILVDGRNVYKPAQARQAGFIYFSVGR